MENTLLNLLNNLWSAIIMDYNIDIKNNKINFKLEVIEKGNQSIVYVELLDISTFYFINNNTEKRKIFSSYTQEDYLEFTAINILNNTKILLDSEDEHWLTEYSSTVNISIEIWNKLLLVEARRIKINNVEFLIEN